MLLLNINRKSYMGNPMVPSHFTLSDLERSKSRSLRFWVVADLYGIHIFTCVAYYHLLDVTKWSFLLTRCNWFDRSIDWPQKDQRYFTARNTNVQINTYINVPKPSSLSLLKHLFREHTLIYNKVTHYLGKTLLVTVRLDYTIQGENHPMTSHHTHTPYTPPPRSIVVRASALGAGGRGSIADRGTPKT